MANSDDKRVLSIQSHVVHGYVGNRSATFPLQVLGFEVDVINSVQFSNHTGYNSFKGQVLDAQELGDLYDGLKENKINSYTHLLTGYIGSVSFLTKVVDVIKDLKAKNPNLNYVCDPVMGDNGQMYVPEELLPVYKQHIIPLADVITPNQFEAELLTDMKITDMTSARQAMQKLHDMGAKTVIISSSSLGDSQLLVGLGSSMNKHIVMASVRDGGNGIKMEMAQIPAIFTGTGDLFAALILAWLDAHPDNLKLACEKTISTMQHVLKRTFSYAKAQCLAEEEPNKDHLELRLVQSKKDIEEPELIVTATTL